jgi:dienelactone hydrolase
VSPGVAPLVLQGVTIATALAILAAPLNLSAAARTVTFRSPSGRVVEASLNEAAQRPAPAVVLVGMLGHSRDDWQLIGQRLADARITTLAIDLPSGALPGDAGALAAWSDDVRGAVSFLVARPETKPGGIGVMGAALGASLAAVAGAADPQIRSLALISPTTDYRGLRMEGPLRQFGPRPAYLVASRLDGYALRSARELARNAAGPREVQVAEAAGSGTVLLTTEPDLVRLVIEWFQRTLG